jgi:D-sedoheptulose 7-phosphate isomerase
MSRARVEAGLDGLAALARESKTLSQSVAQLAERYAGVLQAGGTLFFCGNGGSAADAQHLAAEYVVRYGRTRRAFAALALTTDTSILTAAGNDFGFDRVFARQVEALAGEGDLLVLHSTSGESGNLIAAARAARDRGIGTVAFLGKGGGRLATEVDSAIIVPSHDTGQIQLIHLALEHLIVELVEQRLAGGS